MGKKGSGKSCVQAPTADTVDHRQLGSQFEGMIEGGKDSAGDQTDVPCALCGGSQKNQGAGTITPIGAKIVLDDFHGGIAQAIRQFTEIKRLSKVDFAQT